MREPKVLVSLSINNLEVDASDLNELIESNINRGTVQDLIRPSVYEKRGSITITKDLHWLNTFLLLLRCKAGSLENDFSHPKATTIEDLNSRAKPIISSEYEESLPVLRRLHKEHQENLAMRKLEKEHQEKPEGGIIEGDFKEPGDPSLAFEQPGKVFNLRTLYLMALVVWKYGYLRSLYPGTRTARQILDLRSDMDFYERNVDELIADWIEFLEGDQESSEADIANDEWLTIGWVFKLPEFFNRAFRHVLDRATSEKSSFSLGLELINSGEEGYRSFFEKLVTVPTPGPVIDTLAHFHPSLKSKDVESYLESISKNPCSPSILDSIAPMDKVPFIAAAMEASFDWKFEEPPAITIAEDSLPSTEKASKKRLKISKSFYDIGSWLKVKF